MEQVIEEYAEKISALCKNHKVKTLYAFGSVLTTEFNDESDIDFIVDFLPQDVLEYADNYYALKFALEEILKREIDLLEKKAIKNPYFRQVIDETKQLIYGY
ncbi:MAG: nucleotidyltransferase domain-containing protein [Bergeyella sp.]